MKDLSSANLNWPGPWPVAGSPVAGQGTHASGWDALAEASAEINESPEEVPVDGGSE